MKGRALQEWLPGAPALEITRMMSNVYEMRPPVASAAVVEFEPIAAAVDEAADSQAGAHSRTPARTAGGRR